MQSDELKKGLDDIRKLTTQLLFNDEEYLTVEEAASFMKFKISFFYKSIASTEIPHIKIGNQLRFRKSDLIKYLESKVTYPQNWNLRDGKDQISN